VIISHTATVTMHTEIRILM